MVAHINISLILYSYIHRIYEYLTYFLSNMNLKRKREDLSRNTSLKNISTLNNQKNNESNIHFHYYYLEPNNSKLINREKAFNCFQCNRNIKEEICYLIYDHTFCSQNCRRNYVSGLKHYIV